MEIVESFMKFSFEDDNFFYIENDPLIKDVHKTCEFVVLINERAALIEAKSSSPHPQNHDKFDEWMDEVKSKFTQALEMFVGIREKKFGDEAYERLPRRMKEVDIKGNNYAIYLIVHGHRMDWIDGLQDALKEALREVLAKWHIPDSNVKAVNHEVAKELKLIVDYIPVEELPEIKQPLDDTEQHRRNAVEWFKQHK